MYENVEVVTNALSIVAESPLWDEINQVFYYVDIQGKRLRKINWSNGKITDLVLDEQIGCIALDENNDIIAGMEKGVYKIDDKGGLTKINKPFDMEGLRFNDGKIGPDGKYYLGTYSKDRSAALYCMDKTGQMTKLISGVGNANGLCWNEGKKEFYFNDTPTSKTDVFSYEGSILTNRKTLIEYSDEIGNPDGMTIDEDGMLWVALWGSYKVVRVNPSTGKVIESIKLPVANVASCTFGGKDMNELIITTSSHMTVLRDEPLAGGVFKIKTNTCGKAFYKYKY